VPIDLKQKNRTNYLLKAFPLEHPLSGIKKSLQMPDIENTKETQVILPHQQYAFDRITAIARVCFSLDRKQFPLSVRTNVLLTSPSGGGKSHIARAAAAEMEVPIFAISTSVWIPLGCSGRGSAPTWPCIHEFLLRCGSQKGGVILLDEIDKVSDSTSWTTYLRNEVMSLLDLTVPANLMTRDDDAISDASIQTAQRTLRTKILIIGAGAFQSIWDECQRPPLGFLSEESPTVSPDLGDLFRTLPRELLARFGTNLIYLPPLVERDYQLMLYSFADRMPSYWKPRFLKLGHEGIQNAARLRLGPRFFEELVLEMVLAERLEMTNFQKHDNNRVDIHHPVVEGPEQHII